MLNLTTPVNVGNGARLFLSLKPNEDDQIAIVIAELRTSVPNGDLVLSRKTLAIRNGLCDFVRKRPSTIPGMLADDVLEVVSNGITLAGGYDNAISAYYGAAKAGRKAALEVHGLAAGFIDASLTGT